MTWSRRFEDPIHLPGGKAVVTLRDAGEYIASLPARDQHAPHWQTAAEALLMAAEGRGPLMHARIAMLQALNHGQPRTPPKARRKRTKPYRVIR